MPSPKGIYNLLVIDSNPVLHHFFERLAKSLSYSLKTFPQPEPAWDFLQNNEVEVLILDFDFKAQSALEFLKKIKQSQNPVEVLVTNASGTSEQAVTLLKLGIFDYLYKPFESLNKLKIVLAKAMEKYRLRARLRRLESAQELEAFEDLVGSSPAMEAVYQLIKSLEGSVSTVLITGESGTGKERVAKAIHRRSPCKNGPFRTINCAAIPSGLLESELFGHAKGAFTGAIKDKVGLFEAAHGGTVFLDEIGEVSPEFQVKLLKILQDGEYQRLGEEKVRRAEVRIISATNQNLEKLVQEGRFREDLYYRLNVIPIVLKPLRERLEDIALLAYHFLKIYRERAKKELQKISVGALELMQAYDWPGNVRELENAIERAVVLCQDRVIKTADLPEKLLPKTGLEKEPEHLENLTYQEAKTMATEGFNKAYLSSLLRACKGNLSQASEKAGMDRSNFQKLLKRYNLHAQEFRRN